MSTNSDWKIDYKNDSDKTQVAKLRRLHVGCTGNQRIHMTQDLLSGKEEHSSYLEVPKYFCCAEAMLRYVLVHSEDPSHTKEFEEIYEGTKRSGYRYCSFETMFDKVAEKYPDEISKKAVDQIHLTKDIRNLIIHEFCFVGAKQTKPAVKSLKLLIADLEKIILKYFKISCYF